MVKRNKKKSGFSLVEMLIIIVLIGVLFVALVPKIDTFSLKARETGLKSDFRAYQIAFESIARQLYGLGNDVIKDDVEAIALINTYLDPAMKITNSDTENGVVAPTTGYDYVYGLKEDPWNNRYRIYYISGIDADDNNGAMVCTSLGKNGKLDSIKITAIPDVDGLDNALTTSLDDSDDYIFCTLFYDGEIVSATTGFTRNVIALQK